MLGWTIVFAVMSLGSMVVAAAGHPALLCVKTASFIFAILFLLSLLTTAVRGQAR